MAQDNGHSVVVEQLNEELTDTMQPARSSGDVSAPDNEAPLFFERRGWYYLAFGHVCCFCAEGGGASLFVSRSPLGPFTDTGVDLNPANPETRGTTQPATRDTTPWVGRNDTRPTRRGCGREIPSQNNVVFGVRTASGGTQLVFSADMWTTSPTGLKAHDLQFWAPLEFDDEGAAEGAPPLPIPLRWLDSFEMELPPAVAEIGASSPRAAASAAAPGYGPSALAAIHANRASCINSSFLADELVGRLEAWGLAGLVGLAVCVALGRDRRRAVRQRRMV